MVSLLIRHTFQLFHKNIIYILYLHVTRSVLYPTKQGPFLAGFNVQDFHLPIDVIRNSVFNGKTQPIEGYKQKWPISFY